MRRDWEEEDEEEGSVGERRRVDLGASPHNAGATRTGTANVQSDPTRSQSAVIFLASAANIQVCTAYPSRKEHSHEPLSRRLFMPATCYCLPIGRGQNSLHLPYFEDKIEHKLGLA